MEEEKKEGLENVEGQRRLPPRPMPPRPPLMKKQIVIEGEEEQAVVENLQAEQTKNKVETSKHDEPKVDPKQNYDVPSRKEKKSQEPELVREQKPKVRIEKDKDKAEKRTHERASSKFNKKKFWLITSGIFVGIGLQTIGGSSCHTGTCNLLDKF